MQKYFHASFISCHDKSTRAKRYDLLQTSRKINGQEQNPARHTVCIHVLQRDINEFIFENTSLCGGAELLIDAFVRRASVSVIAFYDAVCEMKNWHRRESCKVGEEEQVC